MKPHIIVAMRSSADAPELPHWEALIADKSLAAHRFQREVDDTCHRYGVELMATREFTPRGTTWSDDEVASGLNRVYRLILRNTTKIPPALVEDISLQPDVQSAEGGRVGHMPLPPTRAESLGSPVRRGWHGGRQAIGLAEAHRFSHGDPTVTVAVLDTGIALQHPELTDALLPGRDFVDIIDGAGRFLGDSVGYDADPSDPIGHGTHIAGIIAGKGLSMPAGIAPRCKLLPVRVLATLRRGTKLVGAGLVDNINAAIKWTVDQGVEVINMSLGVRHTGGGLPHASVVDYARRRGVSLVAASGNDGQEALYYPGALPYVLAVGAHTPDGEVAAFSTYGTQVDLVAPGTEIYSTYLDKGYAFSSGTSHAAPFVAGAIALLKSYAKQKGRRLSDRQAKHVLKHTADKVDHRFKNHKAGFGRLHLADAMRLLQYKLNQGVLS